MTMMIMLIMMMMMTTMKMMMLMLVIPGQRDWCPGRGLSHCCAVIQEKELGPEYVLYVIIIMNTMIDISMMIRERDCYNLYRYRGL